MTTHDDAPRVDHRSPDAEPTPAEERTALPPARGWPGWPPRTRWGSTWTCSWTTTGS